MSIVRLVLPDPGLHGRQDLGHVQRRETPDPMEPDRAGAVKRKHAVEHAVEHAVAVTQM
jgi:hypothetical protein